MTHVIRRTNPNSRWPFRIVRIRSDGSTHKLLVKFETADKAQAYLDKHADQIARFA